VFDPELAPDQWVRQPPERAYRMFELDIQHMCTPTRLPVEAGKELFSVIGLRVQESRWWIPGFRDSRRRFAAAMADAGIRVEDLCALLRPAARRGGRQVSMRSK
jgi:hypothetical protein